MDRTLPNVQPVKPHEANPFPDQICCTCRWWWKGYADGTGWCKRHAPSAQKPHYPFTGADSYCGDWEENTNNLRIACDSVGGGFVWYGILGTQRTQNFTSEYEVHEAIKLETVEWKDLV